MKEPDRVAREGIAEDGLALEDTVQVHQQGMY